MRVLNSAKAARHGGNLITLDPCPVCGVRQAAHWRCARCTARGHLLGHSDPRSPYCDDCRRELAAHPIQEEP